MKLSVDHMTRYTFSEPVRFIVQSLKLTPTSSEGQRPIRWSVSAEGCDISEPFIDGYGDAIQTLTCPDERSEIEISVRGEVETEDTAGLLRGHREKIRPEVFLRETDVTAPDRAIRELAKAVARRTSGAADADALLKRAHELSTLVSMAVEYVPGVTHAHTTAAEAIAEGRGVCQDHAHVLISAARQLDIPARYVSGYLFADAAGEPHGASHAWAELYLDDMGWVGFDAANRICPTDHYIRLGSGLDARDAAPVRGVHSGNATEALEVTLVVQQAQQ